MIIYLGKKVTAMGKKEKQYNLKMLQKKNKKRSKLLSRRAE